MTNVLTPAQFALGGQPFDEIIKGNLFYNDKTKNIYDLIRSSKKNYFLSRPRRFGKSLLLSTLETLFSGQREPFKDLWIGQSDYKFPKHPVLSFSLMMRSESPEIFEYNLLSSLKKLAEEANLTINELTSDKYFESLIEALYKKGGATDDSKVVILIDEYDDPVTSNIDNQEVAQANAKYLRKFFATLKKPAVHKAIRFTFVTGITRYALTSLDSGPNHLNDISLDPRYEGICGFTKDEFPSLFADLMEPTLKQLKAKGQMKPSDDVNTLWSEIADWYDGYNWGGETRVLNPYSILHFFERCEFDNYWIQSGRPGHLTALIKATPSEYLEPKFEPLLSDAVRKSEFNKLKTLPVLFHSGYLTVDRTTQVPKIDPNTNKVKMKTVYTFRYPNYEVRDSYLNDVCSVIFDKELNDFNAIGLEIKEAFLTRNAKAIGDLLSGQLAHLSYLERATKEKIFHAFIHLILQTAGFKITSELMGAKTRIDLLVELKDRVYVIIELKYLYNPKKRTKAERNEILARLAKQSLDTSLMDEALSRSNLSDLYNKEIYKALKEHESRDNPLSKDERILLIAETILSLATKKETNEVLAKLAEEMITKDEIEAALAKPPSGPTLSPKEINQLLTKVVNKALNDITQRGYHQMIASEAKEIIDLGLVIYDHGATVKAAFGPQGQPSLKLGGESQTGE
jgi:hypothetical protein